MQGPAVEKSPLGQISRSVTAPEKNVQNMTTHLSINPFNTCSLSTSELLAPAIVAAFSSSLLLFYRPKFRRSKALSDQFSSICVFRSSAAQWRTNDHSYFCNIMIWASPASGNRSQRLAKPMVSFKSRKRWSKIDHLLRIFRFQCYRRWPLRTLSSVVIALTISEACSRRCWILHHARCGISTFLSKQGTFWALNISKSVRWARR